MDKRYQKSKHYFQSQTYVDGLFLFNTKITSLISPRLRLCCFSLASLSAQKL
ncbi:hypothetical protein Hanom_Chr16g01499251 [Helianthus anomalus]